ncbi:MAG TPA: hypothetical protein ENN60_02405, partial [archaeon]|nr:hypothetical protein [archaeon]
MLAIIRLRSGIGVRPKVRKTLELLRLDRQQTLALVPDTPAFRGMVKVVNDYCMWGTVDDGMAEVLAKRLGTPGFMGDQKIRIFHLNPPRGGFKSIKKQRPHGNLGKQPDIKKWIEKMMP